jgi:hypothetical protein
MSRRFFLLALLGTALFGAQQGYRVKASGDEYNILDEDTWKAIAAKSSFEVGASFVGKALIVFDPTNPDSVDAKSNIGYVLNSVFVEAGYHEVASPEAQVNSVTDVAEPGAEGALNEVLGFSEPEGVENSDDATENQESSEEEESLFYSLLDGIELGDYSDLILCFSDLSLIQGNLPSLESWVDSGGHIFFAAGVDNTELLDAWFPLLGIAQGSSVEAVVVDSLKFSTELMAGASEREFSDAVICGEALKVELLDECLVHATTCESNAIPLLWERRQGSGRFFVANVDLMGGKAGRGLFVAAYCRLYPVFAYPVINASVYCIDDCPSPVPAGYERNVLRQYGYSVEDFYLNVWMPAMQNISQEYGVKFSIFAIQSYEADTNGPFNNTDNIDLAEYFASLFLDMGAEIGVHGYNHQPLVLEGYKFDEENSGYTPWPAVATMVESIQEVISYIEELAADVVVSSYVAPSNVISADALKELQARFEDIRVFAGIYIGTSDQLVQEFETTETGVVYCPRLTADMQMEDSEWWTQINELNYHYVESNFIHPDDILDEERSNGGDFEQMLAGYREMIAWNVQQGLRITTISEAGAAVQRYSNLKVSQKINANKLEIDLDGLVDEAYLMLRLSDYVPGGISGGSLEKLAEGIYVLCTTEARIEIDLTVQR